MAADLWYLVQQIIFNIHLNFNSSLGSSVLVHYLSMNNLFTVFGATSKLQRCFPRLINFLQLMSIATDDCRGIENIFASKAS